MKPVRQTLSLILCGVLMSATAASAQSGRVKKPSVQEQAAAENAEIVGYCVALGQVMKETAVGAHISVQPWNATVSQMANTERFDPKDKASLEIMIAASGACLDRQIAFSTKYVPDAPPLWQGMKTASEFAYAELMSGSISYGDFNRRMKAEHLKATQTYETELRRRQEVAKQQEAEERRQSQANWAAFGAALSGFGQAMNGPAMAPAPLPEPPRMQTCRYQSAGPNAIRRECY